MTSPVMMMKNIFFFCSLLVVAACEYSPSGMSYTEIDPVPPDNLQVHLNDFADTVRVSGSVEFRFRFDLGGRQVFSAAVSVDGDTIAERQGGGDFTFFFQTTAYTGGAHVLRMDVIAESGTGSLAAQVGVEVLRGYRQWLLFIDNSAPAAVAINSVVSENGRLKITWQKSDAFNFQSYGVYKAGVIAGPYTDFSQVAMISNRAQTSWVDSVYIGGPVSYRIHVSGANQSAPGPVWSYDGPMAGFVRFEATPSNKVKLFWRQCPFPGNFARYVVSKWQASSGYATLATIEAANDTSLVDEDARFGGLLYYRLIVESTRTVYYNDITQDTMSAWVGNRIPGFFRIKYVPGLNSIYLSSGRAAHRLDATTFETLASAELQDSWFGDSFDVSANGLYAYGSYLSDIYRFDPQTLSLIQTHNTSQFMSTVNVSPKFLHVSNQNQISCASDIINYIPPTYYIQPHGLLVIDMDQQRLRTSYLRDFGMIRTSSSGEFMLADNALYQVLSESQGLLPIGDVDQYHFAFIGDGEQCLLTRNNSVTIRQTLTLQLVSDVSDGRDYSTPSIDPFTGYMGGVSFSENAFLVKDLQSGALVRKLPVVPLYSYSPDYHLINNTVFASGGFLLRLN